MGLLFSEYHIQKAYANSKTSAQNAPNTYNVLVGR